MPYEKLNHIKDLLKKLEEKKGLCFIDGCNRQSIGSHTISESRILEKLQEKDGKYGLVLLQLEDKPNVDFKQKTISTYKNSERQLIRKGKTNSSVFYGFCDRHDPELFYELDNENYFNNSKINFLHAYRAFALYISNANNQFSFAQNKTLESLKSINPQVTKLEPDLQKVSQLLNKIPDNYNLIFEEMKPLLVQMESLIQNNIGVDKSELRQSMHQQLSQLTDKTLFPITGSVFKDKIKTIIDSSTSKMQIPEELINDLEYSIKYRVEENNKIKSLFNSACLNEKYDTIDCLSRPIFGIYGITGNFVFKTINNDLLSLTFFPEFETCKTQVIISSLENNKTILSKINIMDDIEYKNLLSSIIIGQGTNVFMKPSFYKNLDPKIQTRILDNKAIINQKDLNYFKRKEEVNSLFTH